MYDKEIRRRPKQERARQAAAHTDDMAARYAGEIEASVSGSVIAGPSDRPAPGRTDPPDIRLVKKDAMSALFGLESAGRTCVLNFASWTSPGGGFTNGAVAQEEMLCHASCLYNVLERFRGSFYLPNRMDLNDRLYRHRMVYSPGVVFEEGPGRVRRADVLTCAAPNMTRTSATHAANAECLRERVDAMFSLLEDRDVDTFLAGAWGCGVFGQDPDEVSKILIDRALESTVPTVVFAVPVFHGDDANYAAFARRVVRIRKQRTKTDRR